MRAAADRTGGGIGSVVARAIDALATKVDVLKNARRVRRTSGKSVPSQLWEILRLRLGPGRLGASEYYALGLWDEDRYDWPEKREFLGWRMKDPVNERLNDPGWRALADDKLISHAVLEGLGVRVPEIRAIYSPRGRRAGSAPLLRDPDELAAFLREGMTYPFFGKPANDSLGFGVTAVRSLDAETDRLRPFSGEEIGVREFAEGFASARWPEYIFQEHLRQHPRIREICGDRVGTLRVVVLNGRREARVFRAQWRIPVGASIIDNFRGGGSGNFIGRVDPATGRVTHVVGEGGALEGWKRTHPDTGARVADIDLPGWEEAATLCRETARAFPGLRIQHWDLALGEEGPIVVELNFAGDFMQYGAPRGARDPEFRAFEKIHSRDG